MVEICWSRDIHPSIHPCFCPLLQMTYFGCQQARMYLVSDLFGFCCLTGMSFLVKKEILDDAGGLQAYGKYIGEDYFIAQTGNYSYFILSWKRAPPR